MNLRFRLNLLITVLMLVFMIGVGFVVVQETRISIKEGVEAATRVTIQLLDTMVVSSYRNPELGPTHEVLKTFLESLGHVRSIDIALYDGNGHLIYVSPPSTFRTDDIPPRWFEKLVAPEQEVSIRRIRFGQLIVSSNPGGAIREAWSGVRRLFFIWLGFFIVLNGLVYWMLGRAFRPVKDILVAINRMEHGDLRARLPRFNLPEFSRIGQSFNTMAASLEASTEESRRLALVVKQTADAIMIHDLDGNISLWNPAAERMFGYPASEIIGRSAALLTPPGHENELKQNLAAIAERRPINDYDTQRVTRDGRLLDVALSAAPLVDPQNNRVVGEICTLRDITERKHAEEAERKLEESRQLTQLIQRHIEEERRSLARELHDELGQYVTAIKTFAVAIISKTREHLPEVEGAAQTIAAAANHIYDGMHNIIRQLRPGALDNLGLMETLRDAVTTWQSQYPEIDFTLEFYGKLDSLGETLNINLFRIVQESVNNALRYSQATRVAISMKRQDNGEIELTVSDDGVGMSICTVDQTRHFGLLGMRERAQSLQGRFDIESELGGGVKIKVVIPT